MTGDLISRNSKQPPRTWPRSFALMILLWLLGFALFDISLPDGYAGTAAQAPKADAVIVLTGGPGRVSAGADLLRQGRAKVLLISGVHRDVRATLLQRQNNLSDQLTACCLTLDKMARNTKLNASRGTIWLEQNGAKSVILVTGRHHMPRAKALFHSENPAIKLIGYPIETGVPIWARFKEYNKYLATLVLTILDLIA